MSRSFASLFVLLSSSGAFAGTWPTVATDLPQAGGGELDAAVIVGVTDYAFLPKIAGAADNANDWFRYLVKTRGVPQDRVRLMKDIDATAESITEATEDAAKGVQAGGTVWFIFIGHGAPNATHDDGLLIGADTQLSEKSLVARGVPQKKILEILERGPEAHALLIFDACFSGTTGDGKTPLVPGSQATVPVRRVEAQKGRATILSASDQVAGPLPGHDRPAFSYLLLGAIRGWADKNKDKSVSMTEAFDYVRDVLRTMVRGRSQVPSMRGNADPFVLSTNATEAGPDLVDLQAAIAPSGDIFRGSQLSVPVIDTSSFQSSALREMNMMAEKALEAALDTQESPTSTGAAKRDSWCALGKITEKNPYIEQAKSACDQWTGYVSAEAQLEANMATDYGVLVEYVGLRRRTDEMKLAAVDSFLQTYGKYADHQEVLAAKLAKQNLKDGKGAGIALDTDGDHILVDACPTAPEDFDNDNDHDGCPEQSALEATQAALADAGLRFYFLDFAHPALDLGLGFGLGVYDQGGVPTKLDQPTFRPSLGLSSRGSWNILEAGLNLDWDLTRDLDDAAFSLDAYGGVRLLGVSRWTPSLGVDFRNAFDWAAGRRGGVGVYFANNLSLLPGLSARLTYRYGLEAPGGLVPVHALFLEMLVESLSPDKPLLFQILDEMDLCD